MTARTITHGTVLPIRPMSEAFGAPGNAAATPADYRSRVGATLRRDVTDGEVPTVQHVVLPPAVKADGWRLCAFIGPVEVIGELTVESGAEGATVRGQPRVEENARPCGACRECGGGAS